MKQKGTIYHHTHIDLIYKSNQIESSRITPAQTKYIFETKNRTA
ncbi:hypothetical protein [Flavobacterium sp. 3-210]